MPTLGFRNDWAWGEPVPRPSLRQVAQDKTGGVVSLSHRELGDLYFYAEGNTDLLFTENETNTERLVGTPNATPYVKDAFDNYIVHGKKEAVNPAKKGTKAAARYSLTVGAGKSQTVRLRLTDHLEKDIKKSLAKQFGQSFETVFSSRLKEANAF